MSQMQMIRHKDAKPCRVLVVQGWVRGRSQENGLQARVGQCLFQPGCSNTWCGQHLRTGAPLLPKGAVKTL